MFTIDIETGELSFINPPDFESPLDADGGNTYDVTVVVSDGVNSVSTTLWVTVGNVDENGSTNSAPEFTNVVDGEIVLVKENTILSATETQATGFCKNGLSSCGATIDSGKTKFRQTR